MGGRVQKPPFTRTPSPTLPLEGGGSLLTLTGDSGFDVGREVRAPGDQHDVEAGEGKPAPDDPADGSRAGDDVAHPQAFAFISTPCRLTVIPASTRSQVRSLMPSARSMNFCTRLVGVLGSDSTTSK